MAEGVKQYPSFSTPMALDTDAALCFIMIILLRSQGYDKGTYSVVQV